MPVGDEAADNQGSRHHRQVGGVIPKRSKPKRSEPSVIISASALCKEYSGQRVVDAVTFCIPQGEFCGMLGPNGAGKTTILRMLVGHSQPNSGQLRVLGHSIPAEARAMRAKIGIVPQVDNLDLDFTVTENLMIYGGYFGLSRASVRQRIPELLADAALLDKADRRINELSGGMKRRLSIARALINRPQLLILDEPTTGLDPQIRQVIWQQLRQLQKNGITLILTTHYMEEAERLCDRIILMDHGRILADAPPRQLIADQIEPHVLEVHGADAEAWSTAVLATTGQAGEHIRTERVGETHFYYGDHLQSLVESLDSWSRLRYSYRPANLEDVFLKVTGRELREA